MLLKKPSLLFTLLILFLFSNSGNAEFSQLLSDNELEQLKLTQEEWALELNSHQMDLNTKRDVQPYCTGEKSRFDEEDAQGPIVSIIDPESEGDVYRSTAPVRLLVYLKSRIAPININTLQIKALPCRHRGQSGRTYSIFRSYQMTSLHVTRLVFHQKNVKSRV